MRKEEGPVSKQIFKPSSWLTKIDQINQLILFSKVMITVLAERASGKSTFISLLQSGLDAQIKSHVLRAKPPFSQVEVFSELKDAFNLSADSDPKLADFVTQINERKEHVLLIVDDAQNLPDTSLQEAFNEIRKQETNHFFHLCLVSDFSLSTSLCKLDKDLIHSMELGNLTVTETKSYLRNALSFAKKLDKTMTENRLDRFYELTEGNIARINAQMGDYFSFAATTPVDKQKYIIRGLSFAATAAVALIASSYIWENQFLPSSVDLSTGHEELIAEISQPLPSLVPEAPAKASEQLLASKLPNIHRELLKRPSEIPAWYVAAIRQEVLPSPKRVLDVAIEEESDDSLVVRDRVVVIPKTIVVAQEKEKRPEPVAKVAAAVQAPPPPAKAAVTKTFAKALANALTIQILASPRQADVMRFVNSHNLNEKAKVRLTKRDGTNWYVLTFGEYSKVEHARAALKGLPEELARYNPWVRPVAQLKTVG